MYLCAFAVKKENNRKDRKVRFRAVYGIDLNECRLCALHTPSSIQRTGLPQWLSALP